MALLTVQSLRKEFSLDGGGPLVAVDDVSFTIDRGDCLAIVGESGSGKTTCSRIVAGLDTATSGTVRFDDSDVPGHARTSARLRRARQAQMVFQDPYASLDPRQRIGRSVDEVLALHSSLDRGGRRRAVIDLLDKVGLQPDLADALPRRLSGGQRQRVAIARALAARPQLLILDEAVAALDVSVQGQVLNLLNERRAQDGLTYLFVSHDLAVVRQVSTRCLVMRHGRVVESGPTDSVLDNPQQDYTRALLQAVPRPGWVPRVGRHDNPSQAQKDISG